MLRRCSDINKFLKNARFDWLEKKNIRGSLGRVTQQSAITFSDFSFASGVCGYHVYRGARKPSIGETLVAKREFNNPMDKHGVKVERAMKRSAICLASSAEQRGIFLDEVISRRRHCKQLCRCMEVPCQLEFNCSNKEQMKCSKELLNFCLLKVFSQICDTNKQVYSLLNQWSRV